MKKLGLIGGLSWVSTISYCRYISNQTLGRTANATSANIAIDSLDFYEVLDLLQSAKHQEIENRIIASAQRLQTLGADCVLICTNTLHAYADKVRQTITIPLISTVDAAVDAIESNNINKVLLLGTKGTMQGSFFKNALLKAKNGTVEVIVPECVNQDCLHNIIINELCIGIISSKSKNLILSMIDDAKNSGVEAVILGCTELGEIISDNDVDIIVLDTLKLHVDTALDFALQ